MSFGLAFPYLFIYAVSAVSIVLSLSLIIWVLFRSFDERKIGGVILHSRKGLFFYALRHFSLIAISSFIISSFLYQLFNVTSALGFLFGVLVSLLICYVSMIIAFIAALRELHALQHKDNEAHTIALNSHLSIGFLSIGVFLAGIAGFYQYTQDLRALLCLGLGVAFMGLISKLSFNIFSQSMLPTQVNQRNPALYGSFIAAGMKGAVEEVVTLFETSALALIASLLLGLHFLTNVEQPSQIFLVTAVLFALGALAGVLAGILTLIQASSSLFNSFQRAITLTTMLFAVLLISLYHYLNLPPQLYNRNIALVLFVGALAVNLLLLLLNRIVSTNSFAAKLLLIAGLLLASLLLAPGYGLALLLIALFPLMTFLPLMGAACSHLQSLSELAAIIPASRRVQNEIKSFTQENERLPIFRRGYLGLIVTVIGLSLVVDLSAKGALGGINFGVVDARLISGIFVGGAGVFFLAQSVSGSITKGIILVDSEIQRLSRKIRTSRKSTLLPDYENFSSTISFYAYRQSFLPICLSLVAILLGGIILGSQFQTGLILGALLCGVAFIFSARAEEAIQAAVGGIISSLIFLTGLISLLLLSSFS